MVTTSEGLDPAVRWALNRLGVPWEHRTFGPRNPIEQWFGILKQRIKRFYKRIVMARTDLERFTSSFLRHLDGS